MAMHRALTDFVMGADEDADGNQIATAVKITGGHHYDDRDKTFAPIIARFPDKFEPVK